MSQISLYNVYTNVEVSLFDSCVDGYIKRIYWCNWIHSQKIINASHASITQNSWIQILNCYPNIYIRTKCYNVMCTNNERINICKNDANYSINPFINNFTINTTLCYMGT
jgi:hypothetical protein